jgi:DNA ligase D-like protein (predicted 3'-phosphoesterase)
LQEYLKKRDFSRTPEPSGSERASGRQNRPIFVIQRHDASSEHYDFRLEVDGVLKSWAVPKGPSMDPSEQRLALPTEEHPLEYAEFDGVIPDDEYGAGKVMVWDAGPYDNLKTDDDGNEIPKRECVDDGHLTVWLEAEVGFTEWTSDGKLRHPRFVGLRRDEDPDSVVRERPAD